MLRTLLAGVSLSLLVTSASADVSKKDKAKAKALYDEGLRHYNLAEYDAAIAAWKESYLLTKAPLLLFNIGQAFRLSGDCGKATTFYDTYQREEPEPKNKDELEQAIQLCKSAAVKPVDKAVTGKPVTEPPTITTTKPAPEATTVKPTEAPAPAPPPVGAVIGSTDVAHADRPASSDPGSSKRLVGLITGGAGVALGGAGIYFAVAAHSKSSDLDGFTGEWTPVQESKQRVGRRDAKLAWVFGGAGVVAIGVGTALYVMGRGSSESAQVSITPTDGGAQLAWGTQF